MQKLPIGEQFFARLREQNLLYVDKTQQIYELMNVGAFVFLSRPRRFGKSLLTTTLKEIYEGKRELFRDLWIEDKLDWQPSPVILINFNNVSYRTQSLAQGLSHYLDNLARECALTLTGSDPKEKFLELIDRLSAQGRLRFSLMNMINQSPICLKTQRRCKKTWTRLKIFIRCSNPQKRSICNLPLLRASPSMANFRSFPISII